VQKGLNLTLKIWRQKNNKSKGQFETYKISDVSTDSSFLEMLDILNENLINEGKEPVLLTTIVVKESAVCVRFTLMVERTVQIQDYHLSVAHASQRW
jgi:succinate dehydrogenase/fumarate reductase-like Fe-S protein